MTLDQFWTLQAMIEAMIDQSKGTMRPDKVTFIKALAFEELVDADAKAGRTYEQHGGK